MNRRRAHHHERGMTLVEMSVAIGLLLVVGAMVVTAVVQVSRVFLRTDEEGQGLADAKIVLDRVGRDIREASRVTCSGSVPGGDTDPDCELHLELWLDDNANYLGPPPTDETTTWTEPQELVTWYVIPSGDGVHCDVFRKQGADSARKIADSLVIEGDSTCRTFFEYTPSDGFSSSVGRPDLVTFKMYYDPRAGGGVTERLATTSARIRNG
jgi:type II secretory pathway pseudopilin PulG